MPGKPQVLIHRQPPDTRKPSLSNCLKCPKVPIHRPIPATRKPFLSNCLKCSKVPIRRPIPRYTKTFPVEPPQMLQSPYPKANPRILRLVRADLPQTPQPHIGRQNKNPPLGGAGFYNKFSLQRQIHGPCWWSAGVPRLPRHIRLRS